MSNKAIASTIFNVLESEFKLDLNSANHDKVREFIQMTLDKRSQTFEEVSESVMKYVSENYHPHTLVVIDGNTAQIFEGLKAHRNDTFIVD